MLSKHVGNVSGYYKGSSRRQATLWPLGIVDAWYMANHFNDKGKTVSLHTISILLDGCLFNLVTKHEHANAKQVPLVP
jgi:hypothetical protein